MAWIGEKAKGRRSPPGLFAVKLEEKLPPICLLSARYGGAGQEGTSPPESEENSPSHFRPKAQQFPKTVIPTLKHEARSYFSLLSPLHPAPKDLLLRYPKPRLPIASCERDLDKYYISNGKLKRRNKGFLIESEPEYTTVSLYETRLQSKPDLTGLKELELTGIKLKRRLRKLERELSDYRDKNYLDIRTSYAPQMI